MTAATLTICAAVILAAFPVTVWLKRAGERDWRRHRTRVLAEPIRQALIRMQITITDRLTPALTKVAAAAADLDRSMRQLDETIRSTTPGGMDSLQATIRALADPEQFRAATADELVRLTLGGAPERPELRVDTPGGTR